MLPNWIFGLWSLKIGPKTGPNPLFRNQCHSRVNHFWWWRGGGSNFQVVLTNSYFHKNNIPLPTFSTTSGSQVEICQKRIPFSNSLGENVEIYTFVSSFVGRWAIFDTCPQFATSRVCENLQFLSSFVGMGTHWPFLPLYDPMRPKKSQLGSICIVSF